MCVSNRMCSVSSTVFSLPLMTNSSTTADDSSSEFLSARDDAEHSHEHDGGERRWLKLALATNTLLIVAQLVFTVLTGSLLLFSDTIDGLIDSFSLVIPLLSVMVANKCSSEHGPESCSLEEVSSNTFKLLSLSLMISYRFVVMLNCAIELTREPELGDGLWLLAIGLVGFVVNSLTTCCVARQHIASTSEDEHQLLFSTILHVLSDAIGSLLVFGVGLFYYLTDDLLVARYLDLGLTALVSVVMIGIAVRLLVKDVTLKVKQH